MKTPHSRSALILIVCLLVSLIGGCGKVGRAGKEAFEALSKKADEAPTHQSADADVAMTSLKGEPADNLELFYQYLAVKVPVTVMRELKERTESSEPFQLIPYDAKFGGSINMSGENFPIRGSISISKACTWKTNMTLQTFLESEDNLISFNVLIAEEESLNSSASVFDKYEEVALVESFDAATGQLLDQSLSKGLIRKTSNGFKVEFKEPSASVVENTTDVLLSVESERYRLENMSAGIASYTYNLADPHAEPLYTQEDVTISKIEQSSEEVGLWEIDTRSHEVADSGQKETTLSREVITRNGVPVFMQADYAQSGGAIEMWLEDISFTEPSPCNPTV